MTDTTVLEKKPGNNSRLKDVHCPWCGNTSVKLKGSKGKFKGSVGSVLVSHHCISCDRDFHLIITGDDFFPDRGYGVTAADFNIKFC